jgi:putative aldouronate transport system permease protein
VLVLLNISNFLSNGMEQYYVFQNAFNKEHIQVLDLYVFNLAMSSGAYSVSTALSMLKSVISVVLLFAANTLSKFVRGESIL